MAMILDAFLSKFSKFLMQMVTDEVGMLLGIPGQIEKLGETVHDIQCVLADAERKQSKSSAIERWLMQLKDVMYDADDVNDLCQMFVFLFKWSLWLPFPVLFPQSLLCSCDWFQNQGYHKRLEGIAKRRAHLGLTESKIIPRFDSITNCKIDQLIVVDDIVGEKIEEDTEMLVNWLTKEEKAVRENVCVFAILGMGGIGKSTLAKKILSDQRIQDEFEIKIWVCVSKEVNGVELLKCMIREAGGAHGDAHERSELVPILERLVKGKKLFLILDDVWEESIAVWDSLLWAPMSRGKHGSRLLVTTRDERAGCEWNKGNQIISGGKVI